MLSFRVYTSTSSGLPVWALRLVAELEAADLRAESIAEALRPQQLNWQPRLGAWSVGHCLEHLYNANQVYLPAISAALKGRQEVVQEIRLGWFSRWFIRNYIAPNPEGPRARAPRKIEPAKNVESGILAVFLRSNQAARELVRRASEYDVNAIRFKNPLIPLLRFTVGTGLEIITKHQSRHLLQAEGVRGSAGFPP
ncbi:MAG: DinB family protein [Bryobacteraceae bacterium]